MAGSFASSAAAAGPGAATPSDVAGPIPASPAERRREIDAKLERFRAWLAERGHRGAALSARRNFAWLTAGGDNHVVAASEEGFATLLVTPAGLTVLTTVIEAARLRDEELNGLDVEVVGLPWHEPAALDAEIRARAGGPVPRDADLEPELAWLRAELLPEEVERLRRLGGATARAMTDTFTHARPGETELAVAARLAGRLADEAIAAPVLLAGADERIARYRHPIPTRRAIEAALMLVVVAEQGGLHVAMTRMGWLGGRPDPETE
ncbi:MAG TPA: hypothetical protein VNJ28_04995, partial [Candidatus Limnocylindrales bacterium]|nr:hypothetical protein [Candidatus Limnocylindrales bacterium]